MEFKNILLDLIEEKGISQRKLSKLADIPPTTISGWLNANRLPDFNALCKLSAFFDVSADYLLGISEKYDGSGKAPVFHWEPVTKEEKELLSTFRSLSPSGKARVVAYTDLVKEKEE